MSKITLDELNSILDKARFIIPNGFKGDFYEMLNNEEFNKLSQLEQTKSIYLYLTKNNQMYFGYQDKLKALHKSIKSSTNDEMLIKALKEAYLFFKNTTQRI